MGRNEKIIYDGFVQRVYINLVRMSHWSLQRLEKGLALTLLVRRENHTRGQHLIWNILIGRKRESNEIITRDNPVILPDCNYQTF